MAAVITLMTVLSMVRHSLCPLLVAVRGVGGGEVHRTLACRPLGPFPVGRLFESPGWYGRHVL